MKYSLYLFLLLPFWLSAQPGPVSGGNSEQLDNLWNTLGWVQYKDDAYTDVSPLVVASGDTVTLFNNASSVINTYIPNDLDSLWNRSDSIFMPQRIGDAYLIRIDFTAETTSNDGYATLALDIDGDQNIILARTFTFPKGTNTPQKFSTTSLVYTLGTFIANGGKFKIIGGTGTTDIYDVNFVFSRVFHAP